MADTVHFQQDGFMTMPETDGHGDTCGIDAMLSYVRVKTGEPESIPTVDLLRSIFLVRGWFQDGMTMNSIVEAMATYFDVSAVKAVWWGNSTDIALRTDLQQIATTHECFILETNAAHNLPDNQPGVFRHFISVWGIDSQRGYLVANGDTLTALKSSTPVAPVWLTWAQIQVADIQAYAIFPAVQEAPNLIVLDKDAAGTVIGAHDEADHTKHVGGGMAEDIANHGELDYSITDGETYIGSERSIATFAAPTGGTSQVKTYSHQFGIISYGGEDLYEIVHGLLTEPKTVEPPAPTFDVAGAVKDIEAFLAPLLDAAKKLGQ